MNKSKEKNTCFACKFFFAIKFCNDKLFGFCNKTESLIYEEKEKLSAYEPACKDFKEKEKN